MNVLVTGAAGFIGFHLCLRLISEGFQVIGVDSLNKYYDIKLKKERLKILNKRSTKEKKSFVFYKVKLENKNELNKIFETYNPTYVVNLAAQAGVRYSLINPDSYYKSNIEGFGSLIQNCIKHKVEHLVYASSSSVYGGNEKLPLSEKDNVNHPVSLYAATKRANELIAHSYSHIYQLPATGLRFFTVYGPWGRPDMALFLFTKAMLAGEKIDVYNNGKMIRDFTYIDDVIESILRVLVKPPKRNKNIDKKKLTPEISWAPNKIFNVGNSNPIKLMDFLNILEEILSIKAKINFLPLQSGDVVATESETKLLENYINYKPKTSIRDGITNFVDWYKKYYEIN